MSLPPSSPRLPSPPPPTEIQIGPKSPSLADSSGNQDNVIEQSILDANSARRIHPGTKSEDMAAGPPLIALTELDSAFQLQEHLKALHYHHTTQLYESRTVPITRWSASKIATPPEGVDRALWLYELCRFLINKCNDLIVGFLFDTPPCSASTCPEMRASEWQFLCAVHEAPKSCCAIDYCCHTLDWATNIVTSQKIFPSRLSLGAGDGLDDKGAGVKHLVNIFRRLHRIFAHAWFQHKAVFFDIESHTGLYVLFKTVCDNYELLPAENYKLPPEAEGLIPVGESNPRKTVLKSDEDLSGQSNESSSSNKSLPQDVPQEEDPSFMSVNRTNTRRHIRASPSTGSAVTTVLEADEDDTEAAQRLGLLHMNERELYKVEDTVGTSGHSEVTGEPEVEAESEMTILVSTDEVDPEHRFSEDPTILAKDGEEEASGRDESAPPTVPLPKSPTKVPSSPIKDPKSSPKMTEASKKADTGVDEELDVDKNTAPVVSEAIIHTLHLDEEVPAEAEVEAEAEAEVEAGGVTESNAVCKDD